MKKQGFRKLITAFIVLLLVVAFLIPTIFTTTAHAVGSNIMESYERDDLEQTDYDRLKTLIGQELTRWAEEERKKEETKEKGKKKIEITAQTMQLLNKKVPEIVSFIKDIEDRGDFDTAALITNVLSSASGVANFFPPVGTMVGSAIDLISSVFTAFMGGEEAPSATALLEDNMNQQFDEISNQIAGLENQIGDLSNQINESTNKIIEEMTVALEIAEAQDTLKEFYLYTGKGDFSYNQYRNYIYGTTKNNSSATTAYYNLLLHAQFEGASAEEIKYYYDALYSSLADNRDMFKDYIVGNATGKSIVQYYYDILVARPDYAEKTGVSAELAAIQFAYDLYQTQILADEIMLVCNNYQYTQMLLNCTCKDEDVDAVCSCSYDYGTGKIFRSPIEGDDSLDSVYSQVLLREEELIEQFAKDIAYVLNTNRTYTMEAEDETLYVLKTETTSGITYGKVPLNRTVYLNRIPDSVCELFDIDSEDYAYEGENITNTDGIFKMQASQTEVALTYKGKIVSSICFVDAASSTFSGGSGTVDDPYLISSAYQFNQINKGMDKYYRLIKDIDFENERAYPIGRTELSNGSIEYEKFNGIVDGNGHTISNLTIIGDDYAGVFGSIGEDGVVKNLSFDCVRIQASGYPSAKSSTYSFYAGIIAGDNHGTIRNCHIYSSDLENEKKNNVDLISETSNEGAERSVYFYVGGIAGRNNGLIQFVSVSQARISVASTHDFGGASPSTNKNVVYAGGICGYNFGNIKCAIVAENTYVKAKAKSIYNPKTTINPYVTALAGGITGKNHNSDLTNIQNVYSAASADGNATLDCKSNWGKHYRNRVQDGHPYVPKVSQEQIDRISSTVDSISTVFPQIGNRGVTCEDKTLSYNVGAKSLNFENISVKANGKSVEYEVLALYGFDTTKASRNQLVTMLLVASIGESKQLLVAELPIVVVDYVTDITVSGIKSEYSKNEALPNKITVVQHYASGAAYTAHNVNFDIVNKTDITAQYGTQAVVFTYEGIECTIIINVTCPHNSNYDFNNEALYEHLQTVESTCKSIGYDEYKCLECGDTIKTNYKRITDHKLIEEISVDATCYSEGIMGRVYCEFCNETFGESVVIPMKPHSIVKTTVKTVSNKPNETTHYCENGDHWIPHNYYVTESYENDGIVYTYICKDCGYKNKKKDTNIITNSERKQPVIVVSDGYALTSDDLVTIYVQLINNPGVYGADLGIKYDKRLTLVSWSDGMLFEKIFNQINGTGKFDDSAQPESCGYNFVWGIETARDSKGDLICPDGNLLKLVFKLPNDAKDADKFIVSVVYNQDRESGFTVDTKVCNEQNISTISPQKFITKDGVIQLVDHLPGDINSDNCVDILDVLYLANNFVNNRTEYLESIKAYGDVNLSGGLPNLTDALILLRSLTGGYGADGNPLYSKYQIVLNTNGYSDVVLDSQLVDIYGNDNSYASILDSLEYEMQKREGYKFLGWYTRLEGGELVLGKNIQYDPDQKIQTLYAHWERNQVVFQGYEEECLIVDGIFSAPSAEKTNVELFDPSNANSLASGKYWIKELDYWVDVNDSSKQYKPGDYLDVNQVGLGKIVLQPVWKKWELDAPLVEKTGYNTNSVIWYTEKNGNNVVDGSSLDLYNFAEGIPSKLYGKWTPLEYFISYELEGGSFGSSHPNSVRYDEEFTVNNPTRIGYTFTGWTITGMDNTEHGYWNSDEEKFVSSTKSSWANMKGNRFKNLHSKSGTVTFTANWSANTYDIKTNIVDVTQFLDVDEFGNPKYGTNDAANGIVYKTMTIYYTYGDAVKGIEQGYYTNPELTTKLSIDELVRALGDEYKNFEFGGLFESKIGYNGHSYASYDESTRVVSSAGTFVVVPSQLHEHDVNVTLYALIVPKQYTITLDYNTSSKPALSVTNTNSTQSVRSYYNEVPTNIIMPQSEYYISTSYDNGLNYFNSNGEPTYFYDISGDSTMYCCWEKKYVDYIYITSAEDFDAIFKEDSSLNKKYMLLVDINLGDRIPIGTYYWKHVVSDKADDNASITPFKGVFDGQGHTITYSMSFTSFDSSSAYSIGLFATSDGATFTNIKLDVQLNAVGKCEVGFCAIEVSVGGLVGTARNTVFDKITILSGSKIENNETDRFYKTFIIHYNYCGALYAGGVVGDARDSSFNECYNYATVYVKGFTVYAGGIAGNAYQSIKINNCINYGCVTSAITGGDNSGERSDDNVAFGKTTAPWLKKDGKEQLNW